VFYRIIPASRGARSVMLLVPFGIFGAAVFAEPTVTQIKEVVCLLQRIRSQQSEVRSQRSDEELFVNDL
jgi:hypothetical protein